MSSGGPIEAVWTGAEFRPTSPYWVRRAAKEYTEGEIIKIVEVAQRSDASHRGYFASVNEAWESLPPLMAERFNSPEALRKYCLIKSGHCNSDSITCPSHADALRVSAFVRGFDEFALVTVQKNVVTRYTPKSQSYQAMSKEEFQRSREDVLRVIADMIEVSKQELSDAGRAA